MNPMSPTFRLFFAGVISVILMFAMKAQAANEGDLKILNDLEASSSAQKSSLIIPRNILIPPTVSVEKFNDLGFYQGFHPEDLTWSMKLVGLATSTFDSENLQAMDIALTITDTGSEFFVADVNGNKIGSAAKSKRVNDQPNQIRKLVSKSLRYEAVVFSLLADGVVVILNRIDLEPNAQAMIIEHSADKLVLPPGELQGKALLQLRTLRGNLAIFKYALKTDYTVVPGDKVLLDLKSRTPGKKRGGH